MQVRSPAPTKIQGLVFRVNGFNLWETEPPTAKDSGVTPTGITYGILLEGCARSGAIEKALDACQAPAVRGVGLGLPYKCNSSSCHGCLWISGFVRFGMQ